jgi:hypothetical protein
MKSPEDVCEQAVSEHDELTDQISQLPHGDMFLKALEQLYPNWYRQTQDAYIALREPDIFGELTDRAEYACDLER